MSKNSINTLLLSVMLLVTVFVSEARAEKSWWDVFFPTGRNIPAETLQAPFANPDMVITEPAEDSLLSLAVRHRPNVEIAEWLEERMAELIVFHAKTYEQEYKDKIKYFDNAGTTEYLKFLQENNILKPLSSGAYDVKGFARDLPNVLNEGALGGRYRWLMQVPVMVTFIKTGVSDYSKASPDETLTAEYIINLQLGRTDIAPDEYGVVIESWKATKVEKDETQ